MARKGWVAAGPLEDAAAQCSIADCPKPARLRGWCQMHWTRWRRHGDPLATKRIVDDESRFLSKVDRSGACWLWTGAVNEAGYARFKVAGGEQYAHRWSYSHFVGSIPEGFQIDHLCKVTRCVNPAHLEAVTPAENVRRSSASHAGNGRCKNGHDVSDPANVHQLRSGPTCRICLDAYMARVAEKSRAAS